MGLAGKDDLDRPFRIVQKPLKPVSVMEDKGGPLVSRKPAGKSQCQRLWIEHFIDFREFPVTFSMTQLLLFQAGAQGTQLTSACRRNGPPTIPRLESIQSPAKCQGSPNLPARTG